MFLITQICSTVKGILFKKFGAIIQVVYRSVDFAHSLPEAEHSESWSSLCRICTRSHNVMPSDLTDTERKLGPHLSFQQFYSDIIFHQSPIRLISRRTSLPIKNRWPAGRDKGHRGRVPDRPCLCLALC